MKKKLAMFCSAKDFIPTIQKSNIIYCLTCPGCNEKYIGKTDHNLITSLNKQGSHGDQTVYQHLSNCEHYNDIMNLRNNAYLVEVFLLMSKKLST